MKPLNLTSPCAKEGGVRTILQFGRALLLLIFFFPSPFTYAQTPLQTWPREGDVQKLVQKHWQTYLERSVGVERFLELMADPKAVILDLRNAPEYQESHIRGAQNAGITTLPGTSSINLEDIKEDKIKKFAPAKDTLLLLYYSESLSPLATKSKDFWVFSRFADMKYTNVFILQNGFKSGADKLKLLPMTGK